MKTRNPRKRIMREFSIDEISAVDVPAQEGAQALFAKGRFCKAMAPTATNVPRQSADNADKIIDAALASLERQLAEVRARRAKTNPQPKEQTMDISDIAKAKHDQLRKSHGPRNAALKTVYDLRSTDLEKRSTFEKCVTANIGKGMKRTEAMRAARQDNPLAFKLYQHHAEKFRREA